MEIREVFQFYGIVVGSGILIGCRYRLIVASVIHCMVVNPCKVQWLTTSIDIAPHIVTAWVAIRTDGNATMHLLFALSVLRNRGSRELWLMQIRAACGINLAVR